MDGRDLGAQLCRLRRSKLGFGDRLHLAPLAKQVDKQLLAGGLHAVLPERELRRRLALAQQADAIAQALGKLARIEKARLRGLQIAADRAALARQIGHQRKHAFLFGDRGLRNIQLDCPALEQKGDEGELALHQLLRIRHGHQYRARVGNAGRGVVDVAVQVVLYRLLGDAKPLGVRVRLVQPAPLMWRQFAVGAMVVEHLESRVGGQALRDQRRLRTHGRIAVQCGLQAAQVAQAHLLPKLDGVLEYRRLCLRHRQRAIHEPLCLLDLDEVDRLAHRFHRAQPVGRGGREGVELLELVEQILLRSADVGERQLLQPRLARGGIDELRCGGRRKLGQVHGLSTPNTSR